MFRRQDPAIPTPEIPICGESYTSENLETISDQMDPLALLTRSTRIKKGSHNQAQSARPSAGQPANPQLFPDTSGPSRKRKRGANVPAAQDVASLDFFGGQNLEDGTSKAQREGSISEDEEDVGRSNDGEAQIKDEEEAEINEEESKQILRQHKIKVTLLEGGAQDDQQSEDEKRSKKKKKKSKKEEKPRSAKSKPSLYPNPVTSFGTLRSRYGISRALAENIHNQGYTVPTEVQLGSLPLLLGSPTDALGPHALGQNGAEKEASQNSVTSLDLLTVAPTGSGKTLAFMIPLIHVLQQLRRQENQDVDVASKKRTHSGPKAIVLAPTKELASQIANEGRKLALNTGIKITYVKKGMHLQQSDEPQEEDENGVPPVKADILVSTPLSLLHAVGDEPKDCAALAHIRFMVLDEADVLLDPLFRTQTLTLWNSLTSPSLRVSLWSATMGSNIEQLAKETLATRRSALSLPPSPLVRLVVGLKDSAVPNIDHQLIYAATEQGKLMGLRQILHPTGIATSSSPVLRPPFLVFTQTIERAVALHSELLYDIPPEAGGISRVAVLHSGLSDTARDSVMTRLRKAEVWVLITTDLLSRGVDFRGINGVVNYDVPNSAAAYVHRVGRTGRAGRKGGVAVTLYTKEDVPYIKNVANIIAASQKLREKDAGGQVEGERKGGVQQWLLDALPTPSKKDKQILKKRGVEVRRSQGGKDEKGATKARISTKAGFVRRVENNRRQAIAASRERKEGGGEESGDDFGGFDD